MDKLTTNDVSEAAKKMSNMFYEKIANLPIEEQEARIKSVRDYVNSLQSLSSPNG